MKKLDYEIKHRLPFCLLLLMLLTGSVARAQQERVHSGRVLSSDSGGPLRGINVINLNRKVSTQTDSSGNYRLVYSPGDSVEFRHDIWEVKTIIGSALEPLTYLQKRSVLLNEVYVLGRRQGSNSQNLEDLLSEQNKKGGIYYDGKPPASLLSPLGGSPITFFYELLSKHGKRARRLSRYIQSEQRYEAVEAFFNAAAVSEQEDLPEEEMNEFLARYRPEAKQVENWTVYDAQLYIKERLKDFKAQPRGELSSDSLKKIFSIPKN